MDYSNPRNWNKENLICKDINVKSAWLSGYNLALSEQPYLNIHLENIHSVACEGITLRRPISSSYIVGVNELENDCGNPVENNDVGEELEIVEYHQENEGHEEDMSELGALKDSKYLP